MFKNSKTYWKFGKRYCGLELTTVNGEDLLFAVTSEKRKQEFIELEYLKATTVPLIAQKLKKNQHLQLIINTDQVLVKEVSSSLTLDKSLAQAFPGLPLSNFYVELFDTGSTAYIAVCKRAHVNDLLERFRKANLPVVGFRLGFESLSNLMPLITSNRIATAKRQFEVTQDGLVINDSFQSEKNLFEIESFQVDKQFILSLAGLLNYGKIQPLDNNNYHDHNLQLNSSYTEKNFFKKTLISSVIVLLAMLLVNFLFFRNYYGTYESLSSELTLYENQVELFKSNFEQVKIKEQRVENLFSRENSKSIFFINRLAKSKPKSILFFEVQYQPLRKRIKLDAEIQFEENFIIIGGESVDKTSFSLWIEKLEQESWISDVSILNYGLENHQTDTFRILIELKDEAEN